MGKYIFIYCCFISCQALSQIDCDIEVQGNLQWINPIKHTLDVSTYSDRFDGSNCKDQIITSYDNSTDVSAFNHAYLLPEVIISKNHYFQEFSLDFKELLDGIEFNNWVDFVSLEVSSLGNKTLATNQLLKMRIVKKLMPDGFSSAWKLSVIWNDIESANSSVIKDYFWVSDDVVSGSILFRVEWSDNLDIGAITNLMVTSGLKNNEEEIVPLNIDVDPQSQNINMYITETTFISPFYTHNVIPDVIKLGILNFNSTLQESTGLVIITPIL